MLLSACPREAASTAVCVAPQSIQSPTTRVNPSLDLAAVTPENGEVRGRQAPTATALQEIVETAATLVVCGAAVTRSRSLLGDKGRLYRRCRCCGHCGSSRGKRKGEDWRRPRGAGERHHHGHQRELQRNDKGRYVVRQVLHRLVQTLPTVTAHVGRAGDRAQGKGKRGPSQLRQRLLAVPTVSRGRVPDRGARAQPKDSRIQEISRERSAGGVCPQRLQEAGGRLGAQVALRTVGKLQGPGGEGGVARQKVRGIDNREGNTNVDGLPLCGGGARGGDRSCRDCARQRQATKGGLKNPLPLCVGGKIRRWPGPSSIDVASYLAVFVVLKQRFAFGGGRKRLREPGDSDGVSKGSMRT